jgi:hypothetical protein
MPTVFNFQCWKSRRVGLWQPPRPTFFCLGIPVWGSSSILLYIDFRSPISAQGLSFFDSRFFVWVLLCAPRFPTGIDFIFVCLASIRQFGTRGALPVRSSPLLLIFFALLPELFAASVCYSRMPPQLRVAVPGWISSTTAVLLHRYCFGITTPVSILLLALRFFLPWPVSCSPHRHVVWFFGFGFLALRSLFVK